MNHFVAPLVGAWIEIMEPDTKVGPTTSLPSWERGLKWSSWQGYGYWPRSLPSWERGLKSKSLSSHASRHPSLPSWERGLKYNRHRAFRCWNSSLPSWERGLKFYITHIHHASYRVAPLVGAWIEISVWANPGENRYMSLPSWERGLKFHICFCGVLPYCRSPRGSVD